MISVRFTVADESCIHVTLEDGDRVGKITGPAEFGLAWPSPGNVEYEDLVARKIQPQPVILAPGVSNGSPSP